ncbi:P-loop ATPase, Sll1717 family [Aristaeella lactis]|uniref:Uncharacterized protein n=1 Tax=Aristaeella lactis TaxID=3046383 RepID=A0AC61PL34_9FIRM|nr:hypothetical protein [Aristaeella lactis]QUA52172.1 hypothetical protein JYE50_10645 [Aristaeella lactis]SMC58393.1 hypothetical protein SAMN06297397_1550 [Aristaeella lactis]
MPVAKCFFCYAWNKEDEEKEKDRYGRLEHLCKRIEEESQNRVKVVIDRQDYPDAVDFDKMCRKIKTYDLIVVMCTPDLKVIFDEEEESKGKEIKDSKERELRKEYRIIREMYLRNKSSLFPVILEGNIEYSLPNLFGRRNARRYEEFRIHKSAHDHYVVPTETRREFNRFIKRVIHNTLYNQWNKSPEYKTMQDSFDNLFYLTDRESIPHDCLVRPMVYQSIHSQAAIFVLGRKGSGKSTLIKNLCFMGNDEEDEKEEHFRSYVPFDVEKIDFDTIYALLYQGHLKDRDIVSPHTLLCLFWQLFIIFHCIIVIRKDIDDKTIEQTDKRYKLFDKVSKALLKNIGLKSGRQYELIDNYPNIHQLLATAAVEVINDRFMTALDDMNENEWIYSSYQSKFALKKIFADLFGLTKTEVNNLVLALEEDDKKILVTLDGFDTHSDDFHRVTEMQDHETDEYKNRVDFEVLLFRTLMEVATQIRDKDGDALTSALGTVTHFCILLPKDRYDQIKMLDRDSFKKKVVSLSWGIRDLLEILVRRLEILAKFQNPSYTVKNSSDPVRRMNLVLEALKLPTSIGMKTGDNVMKMSLFNYILRSTFWRPRDVISHMSVILASAFKISGENKLEPLSYHLNEDSIKLAIKNNADKIIEKEFYQEYQYTFYNIREVLKSFQGMNEQMNVKDFRDMIQYVQFDTSFVHDMNVTENKMLVLYQLGVIGLYFSKEIADRYHYGNRMCFKFNEGMSPFNDFLRWNIEDEKDARIIFNPLFSRNLGLKYNTKELIGNWSDDYINNPTLLHDDE